MKDSVSCEYYPWKVQVGNMLLGLSTRCFWAWGIENMKDLKIYIPKHGNVQGIFNTHRGLQHPSI
jgi:hypothetical protein